MDIGRSNYEIWLIDLLDGNLTDLQVEQLKIFLDENPDLKKEFHDLSLINLKPVEKLLPHKDHLKKSIADISGSQFEYLSVAYLENDLSSGQQTELFEALELDSERKRSFELIQKLTLVPASIRYLHKNKLKKRTVLQNVIRLSVIGLSAAATIALLVVTYLLIPRNISDKGKDGMLSVRTQNIVVDSNRVLQAVNKLSDNRITENKIDIPGKTRGTHISALQKNRYETGLSESTVISKSDSLHTVRDNSVIEIDKIHAFRTIDLKGGIISNTLLASRLTLPVPVYNDERSNLNKFIARTFREKILKEKTSKDTQLKFYEIAEAGVAGLDKLFGWEMALDEKNDENGKLRSVYFSSKLLKFNSPVKKSYPLP